MESWSDKDQWLNKLVVKYIQLLHLKRNRENTKPEVNLRFMCVLSYLFSMPGMALNSILVTEPKVFEYKTMLGQF
jgi:hypothetical protein